MPHRVFHKTQRGKDEITQRAANLPPAARHALIMINGVDSVAALMARGLPQLDAHLSLLLALELIELVPEAAAQSDEPDPRIDAQCQVVLECLSPHFGPDTIDVAQPALLASTTAQFNAAIDDIEARLAVYLGRKQAARETQALRLPPRRASEP